jgi:hypothetical protein
MLAHVVPFVQLHYIRLLDDHPLVGYASFPIAFISPAMAMIEDSSGASNELTSDPVNSIAWFSTSSSLKSPHRDTMTSLPVTPLGRTPVLHGQWKSI